jgi:hypothetical protein
MDDTIVDLSEGPQPLEKDDKFSNPQGLALSSAVSDQEGPGLDMVKFREDFDKYYSLGQVSANSIIEQKSGPVLDASREGITAAAQEAAEAGDVRQVQSYAEMFQLLQSDWENMDKVDKHAAVGTKGYSDAAAKKSPITWQNSLDEIAEASKANAYKDAWKDLAASYIEQDISLMNGFVDIGKQVLPFVGTVTDFEDYTTAVDRALGEVGPSQFSRGTEASAREKAVNAMASMDDAKKLAFVYKIYNEIKNQNTVGGKFLAAGFVGSLVERPSEMEDVVFTGLSAAGVVLDVLGVTAIGKGYWKYLKARTLADKQIAAVAGADTAGEMAGSALVEGVPSVGSTLNKDAAKSVSMSVDGVLPAGIQGTSAKAQERLIDNTQQLLDNLEKVIYSGGVKVDEAAAFRDALKASHAPEVNKSVHSFDIVEAAPSGVKYKAVWQSPEGIPFHSLKAAQEFASALGGKVEIAQSGSKVIDKDVIEQAKAIESTIKELQAKLVFVSKKSDVPPVSTSKEFQEAQAGSEQITLGKPSMSDEAKAIANEIEVNTGKLAELNDLAKELKTGYVVTQVNNKPVPLNYIQSLSKGEVEDTTGPLSLLNPRLGVDEHTYMTRLAGTHADSRIRKLLSEYVQKYTNKLIKPGSKRKVEQALIDGDKYSDKGAQGKEFSVIELRSKGLSDSEIEAYYAYRAMRNTLYELKNAVAARDLTQRGYNEITIKLADGVEFTNFGKVVEGDAKGRRAFDPSTGTEITLTDKVIEANKAVGNIIVEMAEAVQTNAGKYRTFYLTPDNMKSREITRVIPKREGEFSRFYIDEYFIDLEFDEVVDGTKQLINKTFRTASNRGDADKWVEGFNDILKQSKAGKTITAKMVSEAIGLADNADELAALFQAGAFKDVGKATSRYTNTADDYVNVTSRMATNGYDSMNPLKRGSKLPSVSSNIREANVRDPWESLQYEITNVSRRITSNEWRATQIQRWHNTFKDELGNLKDMSPEDAFWKYVDQEAPANAGKLEAYRIAKYVESQLSHKTGFEKKMDAFYVRSTEALENTKIPGSSWLGKAFRQSEFTQWARTLNFYSFFGFNPSQLIVQANGMAVAAALHPVHGIPAAKTAMMMRVALTSDKPDTWVRAVAAMGEKVTNLGFGSTKEFKEVVEAVRRSGLLDGINSTSLYSAQTGSLGLTNALTRTAGQGASWFFNRGEEFSRLTSFEIARRAWKDANPGKNWNTNESLREIMLRADDFTSNMTDANRAWYQSGAASIPLQFFQYSMKTVANFLSSLTKKKVFTEKEAIWLGAAWTVLYGANNQSIDLFMPDSLSQLMFGTDKVTQAIGDELNEQGVAQEYKFLVAEGLLAFGLDQIVQTVNDGEGLQLALGKRLSPAGFYESLWDELMNQNMPWYEVLLGASAANFGRLQGLTGVYNIVAKSENLSSTQILDATKLLGTSFFTAFSNADKAYWAYRMQGKLYSRNNKERVELDYPETIAKALGFQSQKEVDQAASYLFTNDKKAHFQTVAGQVNQLMMLAYRSYIDNRMEDYNKYINAASGLVIPYDFHERKEILNFVNDPRTEYRNQHKEMAFEYDTVRRQMLKGKVPFLPSAEQ